jgi:protein-arginine kinase activator protein McsA
MNKKCYFCGHNEVEVKLNLYERETNKVETIYVCKVCAEQEVYLFLFFEEELGKIIIEKIKEDKNE